jgi:hypothetical protein
MPFKSGDHVTFNTMNYGTPVVISIFEKGPTVHAALSGGADVYVDVLRSDYSQEIQVSLETRANVPIDIQERVGWVPACPYGVPRDLWVAAGRDLARLGAMVEEAERLEKEKRERQREILGY